MPIGVIINGCSVILGGIIGCVLGKKLDNGLQDKLQMVFAVCSMSMGIASIMLMQNMPAMVFAVILGTDAIWRKVSTRLQNGCKKAS